MWNTYCPSISLDMCLQINVILTDILSFHTFSDFSGKFRYSYLLSLKEQRKTKVEELRTEEKDKGHKERKGKANIWVEFG